MASERLFRPRSTAAFVRLALLSCLFGSWLIQPSSAHADESDLARLRGHRNDALVRNLLEYQGRRDVHDIALDPEITEEPEATGTDPSSHPLAAIDGDPSTSWRGLPGERSYTWSIKFRRVVHIGLVRMHLGHTSTDGTPPALHWEVQIPVNGECPSWALWHTIGDRDDRHSNEFVHGPMHVHVQRQALFADNDACALRVTIPGARAGDTEGPPVIREVSVIESARSLSISRMHVSIDPWQPPLRHELPPFTPKPADAATLRQISEPGGIVDHTYNGLWYGAFGKAPWRIELASPTLEWVDRIYLSMGLDAVTVPIPGQKSGRRFEVAVSANTTARKAAPINTVKRSLRRGNPAMLDGNVLPLRRRLITSIRLALFIVFAWSSTASATGEEGGEGGVPVGA
ncbi:MAG: hypothetical protein U0165_06220 [Polyangiaceae bacterium]